MITLTYADGASARWHEAQGWTASFFPVAIVRRLLQWPHRLALNASFEADTRGRALQPFPWQAKRRCRSPVRLLDVRAPGARLDGSASSMVLRLGGLVAGGGAMGEEVYGECCVG